MTRGNRFMEIVRERCVAGYQSSDATIPAESSASFFCRAGSVSTQETEPATFDCVAEYLLVLGCSDSSDREFEWAGAFGRGYVSGD